MSDATAVESVAADVLRGLVYTHNRANANTTEVHQARATLRALVDMLLDAGVLDRKAFEARWQDESERLRQEYVKRGMAVALKEYRISKYDFADVPPIDCADRLPLCRAACCRLPFALSKEDVREGIVRWDLGQPYMNDRGPDGYCLHLDRQTHRCDIYARRPMPCRGYDCRTDRRIWLDFEQREINPRIAERDWPACLEADGLPVLGQGG